MQEREPQTSIQVIETLQQNFRLYCREEKLEKLGEKARLETTYNTLQTRLRLNNRKPYVPSTGRMISDINKHWKSLEEADKVYEVLIIY